MQFVRRQGRQLLGPDGQPRQFRGVGIGNWLLPEGYMWRFFAGATRPRLMEAVVADLCGKQWGRDYWRRFRDAFFTPDDVRRIADSGFDHIRLPFNWRLFMDEDGQFVDEGFQRLADAVQWCREAGLLVLFDLHGAPGGQTGANIDDSEHDRPEVFTDAVARQRCLRLWVEIARRWADDPVVMGYDLLNEPCRDEFQHLHAADLVALYRDLTAAIREVDQNHLIMYEGSHWATNFSIFDQVWDENSCLQFHRYWDRPDREGLQKFTSVADRLGLPLYMGEGGENSVGWLRAAFGTYDRLGIGWNFWPWKKLENPSSPCDAPAPPGWDELVAVFEGRGGSLERDRARTLLDEAVEAFRLKNCRWHPEIIDALMQAPRGWVPGFAAVDAFERHRIDHRVEQHIEQRADEAGTGQTGANPFAADPRERERAGQVVLRLSPGEQAVFPVSSSPALARVVEADDSSSTPGVTVSAAEVVVTGGARGSVLLGVELG